MLTHLIRKEILDQILSLRFIILSGIGALVIWLSLFDGYSFYQEQFQDYRLAQTRTQNRIQQIIVADNWSELTARGYTVNRPPTSMSIFVRGLEPVLGRAITPGNAIRARRLRESPAAVEPILGVFPPLDLALVVQVVFSLFVLLFTYDSICGEKESGTLRLGGSFPVPRHLLLLGKFIGALFPILAAFGLPLLLGLAILFALPTVQLTGAELVRLGLIVFTFGLYLTVFTCAGILASTLVHRAATAFVLLLAFWAITVAVLPRLSLIAADTVRPAPSQQELETQKQALATAALQDRYDLQQKWEQEYEARTGQSHWETPEGRVASRLYFAKTREDARNVFQPAQDRLNEAFRNRYNARLSLAVALARFSPAFALQNAAVRLSSTGIDPYQRFMAAMETYVRKYLKWVTDAKNQYQLQQVYPEKYGQTKWDVADLPLFHFQETEQDKDIQTGLIDVGVLALWALLFFAIAYLALLKYDMR